MSIVSRIWVYIRSQRLSQLFFWLFLVSLPFGTRIIYNPASAYIEGIFSYHLGYFLYLSDILFVICFTVYLVENKAKISLSRIGKVLFWGFMTYLVLWSVFHVKHVNWPEIYQTAKYLELLGIVYLVSRMVNHRNFSIFALIVITLAVFQAILGLWQFHVQHMVGLTWLGEYLAPLGTPGLAMIDTAAGKLLRAYGTFPHPNILGAFLVVGLAFSLYRVSRETWIMRRIWHEISMALLILGIFVTFSRVAWIAAACVTLGFLIYTYLRSKQKRAGTIAFVTIVSCATILGVWNDLLFTRLSDIPASKSYQDRGAYNKQALEIFKSWPILGTGPGNYIPIMRQMFHVEPWQYQPPHNAFIFILAELGIIGLLFFIGFMWNAFRATWTGTQSDMKFVLLAASLALLAMSNFDHFLVTIQQGQLMLAVMLGSLYAYKNYDTTTQE